MTKFDYCLRSGGIKKDDRAKNRVDDSVEIAKRFLISSEKNLDIKEYEISVLCSFSKSTNIR